MYFDVGTQEDRGDDGPHTQELVRGDGETQKHKNNLFTPLTYSKTHFTKLNTVVVGLLRYPPSRSYITSTLQKTF